MILHQEHYERARMWGKIGALEGEEPMCGCVDPWKVMGHRRGRDDCGGKDMPEMGTERGKWDRIKDVRGDQEWACDGGEDDWKGVEEKVLVLRR